MFQKCLFSEKFAKKFAAASLQFLMVNHKCNCAVSLYLDEFLRWFFKKAHPSFPPSYFLRSFNDILILK